MWWYEIIEAIRRLAMTGLLVLFYNPDIRLGIATFLSFLSILLHVTTVPFTDPATNALALVSHLLVFAVFFVGQEIKLGVVQTKDLGMGVLLVILLLTPPVLMVYSMMTQAQRDRAEELRRREREVQAEEMLATLDQLNNSQEVPSVRNVPPIAAAEDSEFSGIPPPPPKPPPSSLKISKDDVNFDKCSFPCYVISLTNLRGLDELPLHENAYEAGLLQKLTSTTHALYRRQG